MPTAVRRSIARRTGRTASGGLDTSVPDLVHNIRMPLFEFACRECGHRFEYLTRHGQTPTCPQCDATNLEKQLSVFAVSTRRSERGPGVFPTVRNVRGSSRAGCLLAQLDYGLGRSG